MFFKYFLRLCLKFAKGYSNEKEEEEKKSLFSNVKQIRLLFILSDLSFIHNY